MFWLFLLGVIALMVWSSHTKKPDQTTNAVNQQAVNRQWVEFIAAYHPFAKSPAERALLARMLQDLQAQGMPVSPEFLQSGAPAATAAPSSAQAPVVMQAATVAPPERIAELKPQLDNTSLLLYFGAFLFVASVGLFIGFGGVGGVLKTLAALVVLGVMYGSGVWLYRNRPKLQQAGLAFAGIGIVIAPLVGAAAYTYIAAKSHGTLVWLLTSVLCLGLYVHALKAFRKPLLSYLLIFTFLSLFESGIGVVSAPVYYLVWGLAVVGIGLQIANRLKGYWPELQESSRQSAQIFLPLSVIASVVMLPAHGSVQLGVALLLAATYYGLEALSTKAAEQAANAVVAQVSLLAGVAALTYGAVHHWSAVALSLLLANGVQLVIMLWARVNGRLWHNFASVLLVVGAVDIVISWGHPVSLLAATAGLVVVAAAIWWKQQRADAYGCAALAWAALPYVYGQVLHTPHVSVATQAYLGVAALLGLLALYLQQWPKAKDVAGWRQAAATTYLLAATVVVLVGAWAGPLFSLLLTLGVAATLIILAEHSKDADWADCAALFLVVPLVSAWNKPGVFLVALVVTLVVYISLALRYRREGLRWASTLAWLLLPVALGRAKAGLEWSVLVYAYAYVVAMFGLIFSRAVARGRVFISAKIPLASYALSASLSYVVGYWVAASLAVGLSLFSSSSRLHTSVILGVVTLTVYGLSKYIEKRDDILALLPLLVQAILISSLRPAHTGSSLTAFLLWSTVVATVTYLSVRRFIHVNLERTGLWPSLQTALAAAFVAPASVVYAEHSVWPMAVGLGVAGLLVYDYVRAGQQASREFAGGVVLVAVWWGMNIAGVQAVQAYVHVLVALFGLYAYWRTQRGEAEQANQYLWAVLTTATVPLAFQALGGQAGGLYGWWLLLEQVAIMLLGMTLHKRFMIRWGLYVALGAVLYQLRNLGYAALGVLALFLIGLAIYQLQKHDQNK